MHGHENHKPQNEDVKSVKSILVLGWEIVSFVT
jgi:hypothetical protein